MVRRQSQRLAAQRLLRKVAAFAPSDEKIAKRAGAGRFMGRPRWRYRREVAVSDPNVKGPRSAYARIAGSSLRASRVRRA